MDNSEEDSKIITLYVSKKTQECVPLRHIVFFPNKMGSRKTFKLVFKSKFSQFSILTLKIVMMSI